jgi:hypothetical protein
MTDELARLRALLEADVGATVGARYRPLVGAVEARLTLGGPVEGSRLVEQVQEELQETWVDTSWPACPRHGRHPLEYHEDGWWWCDADRVAVCHLGALETLSGGVHPSNDDRA